MVPDVQEIDISGHNEHGTTLDRCGDVLVIVGVLAHAGDFVLTSDQLRQDEDVLEPQLRINLGASGFSNLRVGESLQHLLDDLGRKDNLVCRLLLEKKKH